MHKLDMNRLNVLERIKSRAVGASRSAGEAQNEINAERNRARLELNRLNELASSRPGLDLSAQIKAAQDNLDSLDQQWEQAKAAHEIAHERFNAAGNLASNVRRWAEEKGLVR